MNKVILCGRLTKDPEVRYSNGNNPIAIAKFTLAVDRKIKRDGQPEADFLNCTAFGKTAEVVEKHVTKGTKLIVEGSIQNNDYTDKNGNKVYSFNIAVDQVEFCESKKNDSTTKPSTTSDGFMNIPDDIDEELPFA